MASEEGQRRGLLIDWGGVLTSDLFESFNSFCALEGLERESITRRFREDGEARALVIALETGELEEPRFEERFARLLGVSPAGLIDRLFAGTAPDLRMCEAVLAARRSGIRTGLVSNSWGTRRYDRARLEQLFDAVVISGEVGIRKPAPEIYLRGAELIGVPAAECVYVDDLPFNLEPAAELGMATVHHTSAQRTIPALERLLGVTLG